MSVQRTASGGASDSPPLSASPADQPRTDVLEFLKVSEVADLLRLSKQTVYQLINDGRLPAIRAGRANRGVRIIKDQLIQWIEEGGR